MIYDAVRVLGLDLSLTSTGIASSAGWCDRIRPRGLRGLERLRHIVAEVRSHAGGYQLAVIEGPAYSRAGQAGHDELAALRWMTRDLLDRMDVPVAVAPPACLKLWATGRGNATKLCVRDAMAAVYPAAAIASSDEADALALASMGAAWWSRASLADPQQRSLLGTAWPEVTAR